MTAQNETPLARHSSSPPGSSDPDPIPYPSHSPESIRLAKPCAHIPILHRAPKHIHRPSCQHDLRSFHVNMKLDAPGVHYPSPPDPPQSYP